MYHVVKMKENDEIQKDNYENGKMEYGTNIIFLYSE